MLQSLSLVCLNAGEEGAYLHDHEVMGPNSLVDSAHELLLRVWCFKDSFHDIGKFADCLGAANGSVEGFQDIVVGLRGCEGDPRCFELLSLGGRTERHNYEAS